MKCFGQNISVGGQELLSILDPLLSSHGGWEAWGHAQVPCPGHAAPPCIGKSMPESPLSKLGHGGNKGLGVEGGRWVVRYEDTFGFKGGQ